MQYLTNLINILDLLWIDGLMEFLNVSETLQQIIKMTLASRDKQIVDGYIYDHLQTFNDLQRVGTISTDINYCVLQFYSRKPLQNVVPIHHCNQKQIAERVKTIHNNKKKLNIDQNYRGCN